MNWKAFGAAFEKMRGQLQRNHQELWRQGEERRRLNAAFSHDLRNPVTVLKGSIRVMEKVLQGDRLGTGGVGRPFGADVPLHRTDRLLY